VTLCVQVYAQSAEARVGHLRTFSGDREVDLIVEAQDNRVVAIEVKLKRTVIDDDARSLRWLQSKIGDELLDAIIVTTGENAYRRSDGAEGRSRTSDRSIGCPGVVEGNDDNSILGLDVHVDDDQPAPRTDDGTAISPDPRELLAGPRELLQREQRARDSLPRVGRKLTGLDQPTELITRLARDLDSRHRLQL
jgi:hypothetical protein